MEIFEICEIKKIKLNILIDIIIYFLIQPLLIKGIHIDTLNISEIF